MVVKWKNGARKESRGQRKKEMEREAKEGAVFQSTLLPNFKHLCVYSTDGVMNKFKKGTYIFLCAS